MSDRYPWQRTAGKYLPACTRWRKRYPRPSRPRTGVGAISWYWACGEVSTSRRESRGHSGKKYPKNTQPSGESGCLDFRAVHSYPEWLRTAQRSVGSERNRFHSAISERGCFRYDTSWSGLDCMSKHLRYGRLAGRFRGFQSVLKVASVAIHSVAIHCPMQYRCCSPRR